MNAFAIFAIYFLFWVMSFFLVLPFGISTPQETGEELVPGQADSAPSNFRPLRLVLATTALSVVLFALFYANYVQGWVSVTDLDITRLYRKS